MILSKQDQLIDLITQLHWGNSFNRLMEIAEITDEYGCTIANLTEKDLDHLIQYYEGEIKERESNN